MSSSSSPAAGDAPPLDDDALFSASGDAVAALLVRDRLLVVAVPRLADLDVILELDEEEEEAGDAMMLSSTSSRPGRESKLRRRARPARDLSSIHRVALKESRNRTLAIASRRLPSTDDRFLALGVSSSMDGETETSETTTACFLPGLSSSSKTRRSGWSRGRQGEGRGELQREWRRRLVLFCVELESGRRAILYSGCRC
jgi:hypothetical protein